MFSEVVSGIVICSVPKTRRTGRRMGCHRRAGRAAARTLELYHRKYQSSFISMKMFLRNRSLDAQTDALKISIKICKKSVSRSSKRMSIFSCKRVVRSFYSRVLALFDRTCIDRAKERNSRLEDQWINKLISLEQTRGNKRSHACCGLNGVRYFAERAKLWSLAVFARRIDW